jgi:hopanoid-associated phosphorylase
MTLIAVTGMHREARAFPAGCAVVVSGGSNRSLASKVENAIAAGAHAVISVGIGGGLARDLPVGSIVIAREVVSTGARYHADEGWANALKTRLPDAVHGIIAGSDAVVSEPGDKAALHRDTGAIAVDMETHIAAAVASSYELPFAAIRAISDSVKDRLPPAVHGAIDEDGQLRLGAVIASIARNPAQIPALIRTGRGTDLAMKRLLRCFDLVGVRFACPYLG